MAMTKRPGASDRYVVKSSVPSSTNPAAPPGPFDPRPNQWAEAPTADRHVVAGHAAWDSMNAGPTVTGADGGEFRPLDA
jgi:hypothetical protein